MQVHKDLKVRPGRKGRKVKQERKVRKDSPELPAHRELLDHKVFKESLGSLEQQDLKVRRVRPERLDRKGQQV